MTLENLQCAQASSTLRLLNHKNAKTQPECAKQHCDAADVWPRQKIARNDDGASIAGG
jgi:hypothetical protein